MNFVQEFASLPLVPGVYTWDLNVYDGHEWTNSILFPELSIVSKSDSTVDGRYKGFLKVASQLKFERENGTTDGSVVTESSLRVT